MQIGRKELLMKRFLAGFIAATFLFTSMSVFADTRGQLIEVYYNIKDIIINGESNVPEEKPFIYNDTTYVPIRYISEALGYNVHYDKYTSEIYITDYEFYPIKGAIFTGNGSFFDKDSNDLEFEDIEKFGFWDSTGSINSYGIISKDTSDSEFISKIENRIDQGYNLFVLGGVDSRASTYEIISKYPEIQFILIDTQLINPKTNENVNLDNVGSILFEEQELGFLAGVAAAVASKSGGLGFVGSVEDPAVQQLAWGYQAGVAYANATLGTNAELVDSLYRDSIDDMASAQAVAADMYEKGIDIIFQAAGEVEEGIYTEAKKRAELGEDVKVIGIGLDQYNKGILSDGSSVTLTPVIKNYYLTTYDFTEKALEGKLAGGQTIYMSLENNGIGIPKENSNLSKEETKALSRAIEDVISGKVVIPSSQSELDQFISEKPKLEEKTR